MFEVNKVFNKIAGIILNIHKKDKTGIECQFNFAEFYLKTENHSK